MGCVLHLMDGQISPCPGYLHASGQSEEMIQDTGSKSPGGLLLKWALPVPFLGILGKIVFLLQVISQTYH